MAQTLVTLAPRARFENILELGCGTGHLSELLVARLEPRNLVVTDVSASMLDICRRKLDQRSHSCAVSFARVDASSHQTLFACEGLARKRYDLIASNAVVQWLGDLTLHFEAIRELLSDGGSYLVSGITADNFPELRALLAEEPFRSAELPAHAPVEIERAARESGLRTLRLQFHSSGVVYPCARAFLETLRGLGASRAPPERPLTPAGLKLLLQRYGRRFAVPSGVRATWRTWYALLGA